MPVSFKMWRQEVLAPQVIKERRDSRDGKEKPNKDSRNKPSSQAPSPRLTPGIVPAVAVEHHTSNNEQTQHDRDGAICCCCCGKESPGLLADLETGSDGGFESNSSCSLVEEEDWTSYCCPSCKRIHVETIDYENCCDDGRTLWQERQQSPASMYR